MICRLDSNQIDHHFKYKTSELVILESIYDKPCLACNGTNLEHFGNFYLPVVQKGTNEILVNIIRCRDCNFAALATLSKKDVDESKKQGLKIMQNFPELKDTIPTKTVTSKLGIQTESTSKLDI